jgi:hypothetical protein
VCRIEVTAVVRVVEDDDTEDVREEDVCGEGPHPVPETDEDRRALELAPHLAGSQPPASLKAEPEVVLDHIDIFAVG